MIKCAYFDTQKQENTVSLLSNPTNFRTKEKIIYFLKKILIKMDGYWLICTNATQFILHCTFTERKGVGVVCDASSFLLCQETKFLLSSHHAENLNQYRGYYRTLIIIKFNFCHLLKS